MSLVEIFRHETAKQRALRVPLDYAYQLHWVGRWKISLTVFATMLTVAYCVWAGLTPEGKQTQLNPGPLAGVHSAWEQDCEACHKPGVPLRGDADGTQLVSQWLTRWTGTPASDAASAEPAKFYHSGDEKCSNCHLGPAHHSLQIDAEIPSCAACHRDHKGTMADINRPDDRECNMCHANIGQHRLAEADVPGFKVRTDDEKIKNVTAFAIGAHPEFRTVEQPDPGTIRFSHGLHLLPGQALEGALGKQTSDGKLIGKKLEDIPEGMRHLYQKNDAGYVTLDCDNCHKLEANENKFGTVPSAGAYMQPIVFEQHCQACHPLEIKVAQGGSGAVAQELPSGEKEPTEIDLTVPHGLQGKELLAAVELALQRSKVDVAPQALTTRDPLRQIPGQPLAAIGSEFSNVSQKVLTDLRHASCALCHGPPVKTDHPDHDIAPANLPAVWFKNGKFDHSAHRALTCVECHEGAAAKRVPMPQDAESSANSNLSLLDHETVMLPKLAKCVSCHAPGGARFDCAECHRYHSIEDPPHSLGAEKRGAKLRMSREQFMFPSANTAPKKVGS